MSKCFMCQKQKATIYCLTTATQIAPHGPCGEYIVENVWGELCDKCARNHMIKDNEGGPFKIN